MNRPYSGKLIVFEGIDGTGKTTQLTLLADLLTNLNYPVLVTKEPTEGPIGLKIRQLYTNRGNCTDEEELALFIADRKEHVAECLLPALRAGKIVLCDRYFLSTMAYQGAKGMDPENIRGLNSFAPEPDLALLLTLPVEIGTGRITSQRGEQLNDFEQQDNLRRVATLFTSMAMPCIVRIDANQPLSEVHAQIRQIVLPYLSSTYDREKA